MERATHEVKCGAKRFHRLTLAFSKKLVNLKAAVAPYSSGPMTSA